MSALPPKADIALHRSECPLCAKSRHSTTLVGATCWERAGLLCFRLFRCFRPKWNINFTIYPFDRIVDPSIGKCSFDKRSTEPVLGRHDDWRSSSFTPFEP